VPEGQSTSGARYAKKSKICDPGEKTPTLNIQVGGGGGGGGGVSKNQDSLPPTGATAIRLTSNPKPWWSLAQE